MDNIDRTNEETIKALAHQLSAENQIYAIGLLNALLVSQINEPKDIFTIESTAPVK